jgi:hypothetical protein
MRAGAGSGEQNRSALFDEETGTRGRSPRQKDGRFTYRDSAGPRGVFSGFFPQERADIAAEDVPGSFGVNPDGRERLHLGIEDVSDPTPREK